MKKVLTAMLRYFLAAIPVSVVLFFLATLVTRTDADRYLIAENSAYRDHYDELVRRSRLLSDEVEYLTLRDHAIYRTLFYNDAPSPALKGEVDFMHLADTTSNENILKHTSLRIDRCEKTAASVRENFEEISRLLSARGNAVPLPMSLPLDDLSFAQIGAGTGEKVNPFYKVGFPHYGLDFIVMQGTEVRAAADGTVSEVSESRKGHGRTVEITHGDGYTSVYSHLSEIKVVRGQRVRKGQIIATTGISGNSFAPHLHYEIRKDSVALDPTGFFFADLTPTAYTNLLYMAERTGQSLD